MEVNGPISTEGLHATPPLPHETHWFTFQQYEIFDLNLRNALHVQRKLILANKINVYLAFIPQILNKEPSHLYLLEMS